MVCILDADKEGFLRSETSLIQTIGRSARHINAEVVLYADKVTASMRRAIDETDRRRRCSSPTTPTRASLRKRSSRRFAAESRRRSRHARSSARQSAGMRRPTPTRNSWPPLRPRCSKPPRSWSSSGQRPCGIASRTSARRRDVVRLAPPPAPGRRRPRQGKGQGTGRPPPAKLADHPPRRSKRTTDERFGLAVRRGGSSQRGYADRPGAGGRPGSGRRHHLHGDHPQPGPRHGSVRGAVLACSPACRSPVVWPGTSSSTLSGGLIGLTAKGWTAAA